MTQADPSATRPADLQPSPAEAVNGQASSADAAAGQAAPANAASGQAGAPPESLTRSPALWLAGSSHGVDHFQQQILGVLYPAIMAELGLGYAQLGVLTAIRTFLASAAQVIYGFLTPFLRRSRLLAFGNLVSGIGTLLTGLAPTFGVLIATRALFSIGSSAQHPVGSSLLAGSFTRKRGTALALWGSVAGFGGLIAPLAAGLLLAVVGWRQIFLAAALASLAMGVACLFYRGSAGGGSARPASKRARLAQGRDAYLRVLRNRNILVISLVMMVGAAGRGDGVNQTYLGPHLANDLQLDISVVGMALSVLLVGSIVGSIGLGHLSDRFSRRGVMQASLLASALTTWWLAGQGAQLAVLLVNLLIYGAVTGSRNSLTQALIADSLSDADRDAAFSLYFFIGFISTPFWALLTGLLMDQYGFGAAFTVLGFSYLAGMLLLFLLRDPGHSQPAPRAG